MQFPGRTVPCQAYKTGHPAQLARRAIAPQLPLASRVDASAQQQRPGVTVQAAATASSSRESSPDLSSSRQADGRRKLFSPDGQSEGPSTSRDGQRSDRRGRPGKGPNPLVRGRKQLGRGSARSNDPDSSNQEQYGWAPSTSATDRGTQQGEGARAEGRERRTGGRGRQFPSVRPRLDLPVVRPGDDDKGTFYASNARFDELGLGKGIVDALRALGIRKPSHVQAATLAAWRSRDTQHIAVADQAGSGKTLAYLLPIFQAIKEQDRAAGAPATVSKQPRAVVVTPTTELVQQVYRVAKALSNNGANIRTLAVTGGQSEERERAKSLRTQRERLTEGVDLVIATPGRLMELIKGGHMDLKACQTLVLDEVDVLLGDTAAFEDQMAPLRELAPTSLRFMLVTATLPQHTAQALQQSFRNITLATGPGLHRTAAGLVEELVDCSGGDDISLDSGTQRKIEGLMRVLGKHKASRTLVFCNKIEACRSVENALRRKYDPSEAQVLVYHEAIREDLRQAAMNAFLAPAGQEGDALAHLTRSTNDTGDRAPESQEGRDGSEGSQREAAGQQGAKGPPRLIMVATDRMSRGIDCMHCQHVVLFDFPRDPSEYVRRVGRTARGAGGTGVVSALVLGRQVPVAKEIMDKNQKGQPVHRLPRLDRERD